MATETLRLTDRITSFFRQWNLGTGWSAKNWISTFYNQILGRKQAIWIDTDKPATIYEEIPQLSSVIDRKASMFANMELRLVKKGTQEKVEDKDLYKLIQNPNCAQSMNEWLKEYKIQEQVFGNQFMYKNKPSTFLKYPVALWNLTPEYVRVITTGLIWEQTEMEGIIERYQICEPGRTYYYDTNKILYSRNTNIRNPIIGSSKLLSLKFPLTNTKLAYQYRNIIMAEKGAIGILSNKTKDAVGGVAVDPKDRQLIREQYSRKFGAEDNKEKIIITDAELDWQPMSYPTKEMMLFEEVDANMLTIIDKFGLNPNIFSIGKATYENVKQGIVLAYQDTIIPEADQFAQALGKFLGIPEGTELIASYDHVSFMKETKQKQYATLKDIVESLKQAVQAGFISGEQAEQIIATELGIKMDVTTKRTLSLLNRLSPLVANGVLNAMTRNQVLELIGLPPVPGGDQPLGAVAPVVSTSL